MRAVSHPVNGDVRRTWTRLLIDAQSEHRDQVTNGECDQRDDQYSQLEDGYRNSHDPCSLAYTQPKIEDPGEEGQGLRQMGEGIATRPT
jgi:hypothetical protein